MTEEIIPVEIHGTPAAIRSTVEQVSEPAARAARAMQERNPRRIYLIGNGTSLYSSLAAAYTGRALAGPEDALVLAAPAGDFRHFTPALNTHDIVVGVSASGEFRDVLSVFERLRGKCLTVGITHVPDSSITRLADVIVMSSGGPSRVPVMTKTYASTLAALHLLLLSYFQAPGEIRQALLERADDCEQALDLAEERVPGMSAELQGFEHAFYFGAGNAYAAALEGALKMKEMALLHAEGSETWEMASGPATLVTGKDFCAALTSGDASDEDTRNGAQHASQWGARLVEIGPQAVCGDFHLPVASAKFQPFASLALVPPAALFAYRMARLRGHNPDRPEWRERYLSQGMTHILGG